MQGLDCKGIEWSMILQKPRSSVLLLLCLALLFSGCTGRSAKQEAAFALSLKDGITNRPLKDAVVVIPENNQTYRPDADGMTERIQVMPETDSRWAQRLPQPYGEITLLVYCPGYYPLALFHFQLEPGTDRGRIPLYLFPDDGSLSEPYALAEGPDTAWIKALLSHYQPED